MNQSDGLDQAPGLCDLPSVTMERWPDQRTCPVICDRECSASCHEMAHRPAWKRHSCWHPICPVIAWNGEPRPWIGPWYLDHGRGRWVRGYARNGLFHLWRGPIVEGTT